MPSVQLTADEIQAIATALGLHSNYIQTGSVLLSAADLRQMNDPKRRPKALDEDQMRKVIALADLRNKIERAQSNGSNPV
jgi:hypothetical protein